MAHKGVSIGENTKGVKTIKITHKNVHYNRI